MKEVWMLLAEPSSSPTAFWLHHVYNYIIVMSVVATITGTLEDLSDSAKDWFWVCEIVCNTIFTIEVMLRVACAPKPLVVLNNTFTWMDIGAIIPFYILVFASRDADGELNMFVELFAFLMPILRLMKITRHSAGWRILLQSIRQCIPALCVPACLLALMTIFMSCIIFWIEKHSACKGNDCLPEDQRAFASIPHTMWFAIVTISTFPRRLAERKVSSIRPP